VGETVIKNSELKMKNTRHPSTGVHPSPEGNIPYSGILLFKFPSTGGMDVEQTGWVNQ